MGYEIDLLPFKSAHGKIMLKFLLLLLGYFA